MTSALLPKERLAEHERARTAILAARKMLPGWRSLARVVARNPRLKIELSAGVTSCTDGETIYVRVPPELADISPHDRSLCGHRDEDLVLKCAACAVAEDVTITVIHEVAHIVGGTFARISDGDIAAALATALQLEANGKSDTSRAAKVKAMFEDRMKDVGKKDYINLSASVSKFLPMLLNACEDIRVNALMMTDRVGTQLMFEAQTNKIFRDGIAQYDGSFTQWRDCPPNAQAMIGVYCKTAEIPIEGKLDPDVVERLDDQGLDDLCFKIRQAPSIKILYRYSIPLLEKLRELGFCRSPEEPEDEPEPQPEPPENEEQEQPEQEEDQDGQDDDSEGGDSGQDSSDGDGDDDNDDESPGDDGSESSEGSDDSDDSDAGSSGEGGEPDPGEADSGGSDDGDDASDSSDSSDMGGGNPDQGGDTPGDGETSGLDGPDEEGKVNRSEGSSECSESTDQAGDEVDSNPAHSGEQDTDATSESTGGTDSSAPDSAGQPQPVDGHDPNEEVPSNPADDGPGLDTEDGPSGPETAVKDTDGDQASPGDSYTQEDLEDDGTPEEVEELLQVFGRHDPRTASPSERREDNISSDVMEVSLRQIDYFDQPSLNIEGLEVHRYEEGTRAWSHYNYTVSEGQLDIPERILTNALMRLRYAFVDNRRGKHESNLHSGKVNTRVLGRRAPVGDDRLFKKTTQPGRKDYFVVIGLDCSGSTSSRMSDHRPVIDLIKESAGAMAEMLSRLGIPFSIQAHSGSRSGVEIFMIKDDKEPWGKKQREALANLQPYSANLDGHTLEHYRKLAERRSETDRIILYYTDGAMPLANFNEELEILEREIKLCQRLGIKLVGVGIQSDDPRAHGLDTIVLNSMDDVPMMVTELRKRLMVTPVTA